jgi:acyl-CoA synthetase (NDP forming)
MAGNYELQKKILIEAGVTITENFLEFSSTINFLSAYPQFKNASQIAVISNAGFETVASADHIGKRILPLNDSMKLELANVFKKHGLESLVGAANPLDLTPMANESAYLESAEVFLKSSADALVFCAVPLTDKLNTDNILKMKEVAEKLKIIATKYQKPILVVVDSGILYNNYRESFKAHGLPTFGSIEEAFLALKE